MALCRLGIPLTDISGKIAGNIFKKDRFGIHIVSFPRHVHHATPAQKAQRAAFVKARSFSHDNRTVSYNIYRCLNGLEPQTAPTDYYPQGR